MNSSTFQVPSSRLLDLAGSRIGRVLLHLLALNRDWKFRWHLAGIAREFRLRTLDSGLGTPRP